MIRRILRRAADTTDLLLNLLWPAQIADRVATHSLLAVLEDGREAWEPGELKQPAGVDQPAPRRTGASGHPTDDLGTLQVMSAVWDDTDTEFWSDLLQMRDLRTEIFTLAAESGQRPTPLPRHWFGAFEISALRRDIDIAQRRFKEKTS